MIAAHSPLTAPTERISPNSSTSTTPIATSPAVAWSTRLVRLTELRKRSS